MNIEHLKTLQEIARLNSFSDVAKKLHISQPAVSFQIQKLEQELGVQLIDRSQRSVELTEAGKRLLRFAETVDGEREKMRRDLDNMRDEISGDLRIGASTIPGEYILPALLDKFKNIHPAVKIQVEVSDSVSVINRVRENVYETGFCGVAPDGQDLEYFKIGGDEIVLISNREHPFAGKTGVQADELAGESFIFREDNSGTQRSLENMLKKTGLDIKKLTTHLVLGSTQAVISAVGAGAGIAFISSLAIKNGSAPAVKQIPLHCPQFNRDFFCIFRRDRTASRIGDEFKKFMKIETGLHA